MVTWTPPLVDFATSPAPCQLSPASEIWRPPFVVVPWTSPLMSLSEMPPFTVWACTLPSRFARLIPPFSVCNSAARCRGTCSLKFTDQLPVFGPSAWIVPAVSTRTSRTSCSASSRDDACAITCASSATSLRSSPTTSIPPFLPVTFSCPPASGRVVRRLSQTRSREPHEWCELPSVSLLHGAVVNDCAKAEGTISREATQTTTIGRIKSPLQQCFPEEYAAPAAMVPSGVSQLPACMRSDQRAAQVHAAGRNRLRARKPTTINTSSTNPWMITKGGSFPVGASACTAGTFMNDCTTATNAS